MGHIATDIEWQIRNLTERGMVFDLGVEKAKEILLDVGFYRLGFYWFHFERDVLHNFREGSKFSDAVALYYLDVDLKNILNKAINRIEINFRTKLVYSVCNEYPEFPTWFANRKVMTQGFVDGFSSIYNDDFKRSNKPIKKHHDKHPNDIYAPAWKTLEFLTFGSIYKLYFSLLNVELKSEIANLYGFKKVDVFLNYLKTVIYIRNICAHSALLYDSNTPRGIRMSPLIEFHNNNRFSLDSSIKVILYFLGTISINRKLEIENEIINLFRSFDDNEVIVKIITEKIGYRKK